MINLLDRNGWHLGAFEPALLGRDGSLLMRQTHAVVARQRGAPDAVLAGLGAFLVIQTTAQNARRHNEIENALVIGLSTTEAIGIAAALDVLDEALDHLGGLRGGADRGPQRLRRAEETVGPVADGGGPAIVRRRAGLGARHYILDRVIDGGSIGMVAGAATAGSFGTALEVGDELLHHGRGAGRRAQVLRDARALAHDAVLPVAHLGRRALIGAGPALRAEEQVLDVVLDRGGGRIIGGFACTCAIRSTVQVGQELLEHLRGALGRADGLLDRVRRAEDAVGPVADLGGRALVGRGGVLRARHDVREGIPGADGAQEDEAVKLVGFGLGFGLLLELLSGGGGGTKTSRRRRIAAIQVGQELLHGIGCLGRRADGLSERITRAETARSIGDVGGCALISGRPGLGTFHEIIEGILCNDTGAGGGKEEKRELHGTAGTRKCQE